MPAFVIAGASLAGAKAAETLRDEGFDGEIVLLGAEPERPYERPPLSKGYLLGKDSRDSIYVHAAEWYAEHHVDLRQGVTVTAIDRGAATLAISGPAGEEEVSYDKLLLATGASPRRLAFSAPAWSSPPAAPKSRPTSWSSASARPRTTAWPSARGSRSTTAC